MRARVVVAILAVLALVVRDASACGMFVAAPRKTDNEKVSEIPYLDVEQVLLVWDKATETEDFIRETRFERAGQTFGFVVPVPQKPEVSAMKTAPFDALRKDYPFFENRLMVARGGGGGMRGGPPDAGVTVLGSQRIGSFVASTLVATDTGSFDRWLGANGFATSTEARPWLEHYVRLEFYFVAFKYDAADAGSGQAGMTSETVRIRFKTSQPYYPYSEPAHAYGAPRPKQRQLSGWLVTHEPMIDVASLAPDQWGRPFELGGPTNVRSEVLAKTLGGLEAAIAKDANLVVQPFRDRKLSRAGYGDVVFVPSREVTLTPAQITAREQLLGVIEPRLVDDPLDAGVSPVDAPPPPQVSVKKHCSMSAGGDRAFGGGAMLLLMAFALLALRRRRALALTMLLGCGKTQAMDTDASAASADASRLPFAPSKSELREGAIVVLSGRPGFGEHLVKDNDPYDDGLRPIAKLAAQPTIEGGPMSEPKKVIDGLQPMLRDCFRDALRSDPSIYGMLKTTFDVTETGSVEKVSFEITGVLNEPMTSCSKFKLEQLRLPPAKTPAHVVVTYRFVAE